MTKKGNFSISNIGRDLNVGGDIIGGNKIITMDSSTTITNYGFKKEEDKAEFASQIDELLSMMQQIKSQFNEIKGLDKDKKGEILTEITEQTQALEAAKKEAAVVPVGQKLSKEKARIIAGSLDKATTLMAKIQKMGEKTADFANKIIPFMSKVLPILINIRKLFGLP